MPRTRKPTSRRKAGRANLPARQQKDIAIFVEKAVGSYLDTHRGGWWPIIREPYTGAWQRNEEISTETVLSNGIVYRCIALIASDIAKMRVRLVERDGDGIWTETESSAFSPVLRKPNDYQNRIQFFEHWMCSKLSRGNTYVLKQRDDRNVVRRLYVLDPDRCRPLVAPDGSVFYDLRRDDLSGLPDDEPIIVPASEIIHDRMNAYYHPLCGLSPIYAAGLPAIQGIEITRHSHRFFKNGASPGFVLTAPGSIPLDVAARIKAHWEGNYTGENVGRIAVLGDGLKPERFSIDAVDSELIKQLEWTAKTICSVFGVPGYKVGIEPAPAYNNIAALNLGYYQDLQIHIESIELLLDEGLGLDEPKDGKALGTEFDIDDLVRMDLATMMDFIAKGIGAGAMKPDEGRKKLGLKPVAGGDTPYLQQQNYSLAALNKRDTREDPFAAPNAPAPPPPEPAANDNMEEEAAAALIAIRKGLAIGAAI